MADQSLTRVITSPQYFTLAFGCIVGVAWIVILGDIIEQAGPFGTAAALAIGGAAILLVGVCYAEMAARRPAAGGELVYAVELGGVGASYATGWILTLVYVSVCVFEAISLGAVADLLFPGLQGPVLYELFGEPVRLGGVAVGAFATVALAALNILGTHLTTKSQEWVTYGRVALMVVFLLVAMAYGTPENLFATAPQDAAPKSELLSFLAVLTTAPFWYAGFSVFASATEENRSSLGSVGKAVLVGILLSAVFYVALVLSISSLVPWYELADMELPAATAFQQATGSAGLTRVVLVVALLGNLTAWNAILIAGARVLFAMGRARIITPWFGRVNSTYSSPANAILFISAICIVGLFLGRGFILPIVNISSAGFAATYVVTCWALIRLRKAEPGVRPAFRAWGGLALPRAALLAALSILVIAVVQPGIAAGGELPAEWLVMAGWGLIGLLLWRLRGSDTVSLQDCRRLLGLGASSN